MQITMAPRTESPSGTESTKAAVISDGVTKKKRKAMKSAYKKEMRKELRRERRERIAVA